MSSASYGLVQGLQRATVTRGLAAGPERFEGRSRYSSLSPRGRPSGVSVAEEGPTAIIVKGPVQFKREFLFEDFIVSAFPQTLADSGGGVVDPYPSASRVFRAVEEGIGESGIASVYPSNGEGVLFSHMFVGLLLTLASEVAIGELISVEVLMGITVRSIKDDEGEGAGGVQCGLYWGQGPWRR